jgi:hypothetical protein
MKTNTKAIAALTLGMLVGAPLVSHAEEAARHQGQVNRRLRHQHHRIRQGVKSGELTKSEAKELREHDKAIHAEEREMRKENGGKLTPEDKKKLNKELDENSRDISQEKHDAEKK